MHKYITHGSYTHVHTHTGTHVCKYIFKWQIIIYTCYLFNSLFPLEESCKIQFQLNNPDIYFNPLEFVITQNCPVVIHEE